MPFGIAAIAEPLCQCCFRKSDDNISQTFVFVDKQLHIFFPSPVVRWPDEPVGAFYWKSLFSTRQASTCNVLPIRGMNCEFPNIVPFLVGSPGRLALIQPSKRAEKRWTVPRRSEKCFIK